MSHRNTGRASGDPHCERILTRVAADENLHMLFYRNLLAAAFEFAPDDTMRAVTEVVTGFQMPGHTIDGFLRKSVAIANAGIYDLRLHLDDVLSPVLRQWRVFEMTGLGPEGEKARDELRPSSTASTPPRPASSNAARSAGPARPPARRHREEPG